VEQSDEGQPGGVEHLGDGGPDLLVVGVFAGVMRARRSSSMRNWLKLTPALGVTVAMR
jgi:hypothetical protein